MEAVYRLTADRGVDHILELAGGTNLGRSIEAVALHGTISVIGVFEGFTVTGPSGPLLLKEPTIRGINVGTRRPCPRHWSTCARGRSGRSCWSPTESHGVGCGACHAASTPSR
ncbi:zinc-binding dehydrogenase [Corallococcus exercitus]|uniref:zinc-binding dehydrogenase n=1 Tax=Corallococcus exercitus TaxID=2316736 RepID=UPI0034E02398